MAELSSHHPVNGNTVPTLGQYEVPSQQFQNSNNQNQFPPTSDQLQSASNQTPASETTATADLSKDVVGWYFVEQYYTTLSQSPEKLHVSLLAIPVLRKEASSHRTGWDC